MTLDSSVPAVPDSALDLASRSRPWRERLVATLVAQGSLHTPALREAFLRVPRETWISAYYEPMASSDHAGRWQRREADPQAQEHWAAWLEALYRDVPLVIRLQGDLPVSSSSAPTAMARMLEALEVQPGQHVLEIGTGTGYTAAVLAELVGPTGQVWTVELEEELAHQARVRLQAAGFGERVQVIAADGWQGYAPAAPYERLIATASVPGIPRRWVEQLTPAGRLVVEVRGELAGGLLVLERARRGPGARGRFLPPPLHFMPLQPTPQASPLTRRYLLLRQQAVRETAVVQDDPFPQVLQEPAFRFWLQWWLPTAFVRVHRLPGSGQPGVCLVERASATLALFEQQAEGHWRLQVHGPRPLWRELQEAYGAWERAGRPDQEAYEVELNEQEGQGWLAVPQAGASRCLVCPVLDGPLLGSESRSG
ncbi:rRNA adenine N-6-methyltransferase family protein [Thermogemmatispora carboxidivorans]|uniref:rRNA adenine N-6-methyltransferase family protein n=1 Tax=Thermogemmatispora carboxidivorans TaxID=1382306 RepID=UPI000699CBFF|nr:rRNA adenine N-6-methyltransferase family protein [Thermogemmatispora carboxidivorans]